MVLYHGRILKSGAVKREEMKKLASLTLSLFLLSGPAFADSPKDTPKNADAQPAKSAAAAKPATSKTSAEIAAEVEELRQSLQAQQEQLQMLKEELAKRDRQIEEAREAAAAANSRATEASAKATEAAATSAEVKTTTTALNSSVASLATSNAAVVAADGQGAKEEKGPTTRIVDPRVVVVSDTRLFASGLVPSQTKEHFGSSELEQTTHSGDS